MHVKSSSMDSDSSPLYTDTEAGFSGYGSQLSDGEAALESLGVDFELMAIDSDDDSISGNDKSRPPSVKSATTSVMKYRRLHGRTYHNFEGAEYWAPNDEKQNKGLDIAHTMMDRALDNRLFLAPLKNPQMVLDIGTGTGIWAIDFADEFPSASVIGTDISPIQPHWLPPNCKFELDNCELEWTFAPEAFDYIHIRGLAGCVRDWPRLYSQCLRCLKPGGWLEHHEYSVPMASNVGQLPGDCVWTDWQRIFGEAGRRMGRTFDISDNWRTWLREAGFEGALHASWVKLPIGPWALDPKWKEVGMLNQMYLENGLEGFASYICRQTLGWSDEQVATLLARAEAAIKDKSIHAYYPLESIYTQKPMT